jgi:hypothetical protein
MPVSFLDASGNKLGGSGVGIIYGPLYRTNGGAGNLSICLGPGDVGMTSDDGGLDGVELSQIASITYTLGALNIIDAVPSDDAVINNVDVVDDGFGSFDFTGDIHNAGTTSFSSPGAHVFGVTSAGRPFVEAWDLLQDTVLPGDTVHFMTISSFKEKVTDTAAFVDVHEP